jgi:prevent-host-death family protein
MADVRARELRNDLSGVLRRVEAGERVRITVRGRPVADLSPVASRPRTMPWSLFWHEIARHGADAGLEEDLRAAVPGDTDEIRI